MKIYDCFQFFNEENILDLRLNILDEHVDFFVIVESTTDHQGNEKKLNFDINKYKKFQKKIIYIVVEDTLDAIKKPHLGQNSLVMEVLSCYPTNRLKNYECSHQPFRTRPEASLHPSISQTYLARIIWMR